MLYVWLTLLLIPRLNLNQKRLPNAGWLVLQALTGSLAAKFHVSQSSKGALKVGQQVVGIAVVPVRLGYSKACRYWSWHGISSLVLDECALTVPDGATVQST